MARFFGEVGFATTVESTPGVWTDAMQPRDYYGDVVKNTRQLQSGDQVNSDVNVANSLSIIADDYAMEHFLDIKYVYWLGGYWIVTNVAVQPPRLVLDIGGVYNGRKA
jgi:hypothetical protein